MLATDSARDVLCMIWVVENQGDNMDINEFRAQMGKVKLFEKDEDYHEFDRLTTSITGKEDIAWLDCLLDSICVEDDYGPYEGLYNAIWRFPIATAGKRLGEYLPALQRRMAHAPFQVWRFYIPIPHEKESTDAFLEAAAQWNSEDLKLGLDTIKAWITQSGRDEKEWAPLYQKLGGKLPTQTPVDPIPDEYQWPAALIERVTNWRALPPDKNNVRVFWFGGHETHIEEWKSDFPRIIEALALRHGNKWRDINVWINPFGTFARKLYPDFVEAFAKAPEDIRNRALANVKKARKHTYDDICKYLSEKGITVGKEVWPK